MSDRIFGLIIAGVALAFFASATQLEQPFFADPLGPKAFPYLISVVAFIAASMMIFSPDKESNWPNFKTLIRISVAGAESRCFDFWSFNCSRLRSN